MKSSFYRLCFFLLFLLGPTLAQAQSVAGKLTAAFTSFQNDPQLRNGMASLYVLDAQTGQAVFDQNSQVGLAPASTLKVITSVSAYELLGQGFRYKTAFAYGKRGEETTLYVLPSGDPTFGSWRWPGTKEEEVIRGLTQALQAVGIKSLNAIVIGNDGWNEETVPDGWVWQDIGNYYGAGPAKLNWRENQFDVHLKSGKNIGSPVQITGTAPHLKGYSLRSEVTAAAAGSGDQAYIYFPLNGSVATIRGTIPVNQSHFKISGALPSAAEQFVSTLREALAKGGIQVPDQALSHDQTNLSGGDYTVFHTVTSPPLDSIIYWFNKKSINLYGEALVKTIGFQYEGKGASRKGVERIQKFWKERGLPESELNLVDGSGLSPFNRVTTRAEAQILLHARKQPWFKAFYSSLPRYNGMPMKSGTIRGTKGFCGYHTSKEGKEYVFSFLVNNYNGSAGGLVQKMYKVLDELK
ncbi:D-alanyl-D-alanine carboxypeptidase/D-alanyl-D-alanine-endopeptidase [soil metagenome]